MWMVQCHCTLFSTCKRTAVCEADVCRSLPSSLYSLCIRSVAVQGASCLQSGQALLQAEPVTVVRIDKDALQQCLNWGFDQASLVAALKARQSNKATVAYHLVVDNRTFDHHNDYLQMELGDVNAARLQHPSGIMGSIGDGCVTCSQAACSTCCYVSTCVCLICVVLLLSDLVARPIQPQSCSMSSVVAERISWCIGP
jgi:hypothetical protein